MKIEMALAWARVLTTERERLGGGGGEGSMMMHIDADETVWPSDRNTKAD